MSAVLSDLDGVLVDSGASVARAWQWWGARTGIAIDPIPHGRPSQDVIATLAPHLDAEEESRAIEGYEVADIAGVVALPGARELFALSEPVAVVTSGTIPLATGRLRAAGLPIPDVLVTPERLARGKPDPEGYLLAARELDVDPSTCTVLEDAPAGIAAGRAAGMHVVAITTTFPADELDADEIVPSVAAWLGRRTAQSGS